MVMISYEIKDYQIWSLYIICCPIVGYSKQHKILNHKIIREIDIYATNDVQQLEDQLKNKGTKGIVKL